MSTDAVPACYHESLTAQRAELTTLPVCVREFLRRFSPRMLLGAIAGALVWRATVGRWTWHDAAIVVVVVALQPFTEWIIHRYLLHLPAFTVFGRRIELYGSIQHRRHHRNPSDLDRVLLKPIEVTSVLVQIAALALALCWLGTVSLGGPLLPQVATAMVISYLGLFRYELSHFLIHTPYVPKSEWYRRIWRNHRLHHFKHEGYWLGVSSNLGDRVLGTNPDQRTVRRSPTVRTLGVETPD
jgi:hypothetical protein